MATLTERLQSAVRALGAGDAHVAAQLAAGVARDAPQLGVAQLVLGRALLACGRGEDALRSLRRASELDPGSAEAWVTLAAALQSVGRVAEPLECLARALSLAPRSPSVIRRTGHLLLALGELDDAEACFRAGADGAEDVGGLCSVRERRGDLAGAIALVEAYPEALGTDLPFTLAAARALRRVGRPSEAAAALDRIDDARLPPDTLAGVDTARGSVFDELGQHDAAFAAFARANLARGLTFDAAGHSVRVGTIIQQWTAERLSREPRANHAAGDAVLIVGMPRSGTTLLETILARHPQVRACGELDDLPQLERELGAGLGLDAAAMRYLSRLRRDGSAKRIVDKLPLNFLSLHTATRMLPGARVIHMRRDPMDTCLSCYFKDFHSTLAWATDLRACGLFYVEYARLMAHWRQNLPLPLLEVDYERLVAAPEAELRRILVFLELDWDPACLRFKEPVAPSRTASYAQAARPIYADAIGRARAYAAHLEPLREALGEIGCLQRHRP